MTAIRPDLVASRYDGIAVGPSLLYSFETQDGVPVDGTRPLSRLLSPFTLRLVPPDGWDVAGSAPSQNVGLIGRAGVSMAATNAAAAGVREMYGKNAVLPISAGTSGGPLGVLQQSFSAGVALIEANGVRRDRAVLADAITARDWALQVIRILLAPPLTLLVNPESMAVNYGTVQKHSDRVRTGYVFDRWGETQPTISFSGKTGAFIAGENARAAVPSKTETTTPTGVQAASRRNSAAWQTFTSLFHFYKSNGYIYDTVGRTGVPLAIGAVAIDYDQMTYVGHIESLSWDFTADSPHTVGWSMEFTADRIYDLAGQPFGIGPMAAPIPNPATGAPGTAPSSPFTSSSNGLDSQTVAPGPTASTPFALLVGRK